jgi:hypothetical protein
MRFLRVGSIKERLLFRRRIEPNGCWIWLGCCAASGYGTIRIDGKQRPVHRISYTEFIGEPKNLVLHKRECSNKRCFNPDHLYDGTNDDNVEDFRVLGGFIRTGKKK